MHKQREIKFRAWDKGKKSMTMLGASGEDILYFEGENIYWTRNHDGDGYIVGGFELMQFTGLKDKNGKEIYEGDLVRYQWGIAEKVTSIGKVEYLVDGFTLEPRRYPIYLKDAFEKEVVGNIYENPELLKVMA